jgi:uncharacterized protein YhbP (UPF0306 family)
MELKLKYEDCGYTEALLNKSISQILESNILMSMASLAAGTCYIHTAYYAYDERLTLYFLSKPKTQHSRNFETNPSVAVSIFDSHQVWDNPKKGLQLFGTCHLASGADILKGGALYAQRFTGLMKFIKNIDDLAGKVLTSKIYRVDVEKIQLFDEDNIGEDTFLPLTLMKE